MLAHRVRRLLHAVIDNVPWPSTIIGLVLIAVLGLSIAGSTWPPTRPTGAAPTVVITPDDPAAPTPVPVQELER